MKTFIPLVLVLLSTSAFAGHSEISIKVDNTTYGCKATACFKQGALQKDFDSALKDSSYWCDPARKGGQSTCRYYQAKMQAIKHCSAECGTARCTKQNLTTRECVFAEFK